jgi:hypothetical protein
MLLGTMNDISYQFRCFRNGVAKDSISWDMKQCHILEEWDPNVCLFCSCLTIGKV